MGQEVPVATISSSLVLLTDDGLLRFYERIYDHSELRTKQEKYVESRL
jgi:hypothetical protein